MKRAIWIAALLLASALGVAGQATNVHGGGMLEGTSNLGFSNPIYGGTAGGDLRLGRLVISGDVDVLRVKKTSGGPGYQASARETARFYVKPSFFVQAGAVEQHYSVRKFAKSSMQPFVGAGFVGPWGTAAANFRQDTSSENRSRVVEGVVSLYLPKHIYARGTLAAESYKSGSGRSTGAASSLALGLYF